MIHEVRQFPAPTGIPTSVTLHELALLQRFAHEAGTVLEIGTHYGFSCIGMALAGAHVTSVDPHYEGPANAPNTWEPFHVNIERHRIPWGGSRRRTGEGYIDRWRATIEECEALGLVHGTEPLYRCDYGPSPGRSAVVSVPIRFGLVFIDGNHTWPCPWRDAEIAVAHLAEGGYIAFHDVTPNWPGVYRAALQLQAKGWTEVGRAQTLRVYQRPT